jgi:glycosyltransferase involved in cell wall biosynthesis
MSQFLVTNLFYWVDITVPEYWRTTCEKLQRDFPWLLTEHHDVVFSGIGKGWYGWRRRDRFSSHAGFKSGSSALRNAALSWLTHFLDAARLVQNQTLTVIAPTPDAGLGAALAKMIFRRRLRLVVRVQGHTASKSLYTTKNMLQFRIVEGIERFVLRRADLVLPMGKFTTELALSQGVNPDRTIIVPFPVNWAKRAQVLDLPLTPNILFVGRLEKEKGVEFLLQAMVLLRNTVPNVCLHIAGSGNCRAELESRAEFLGLRDKVLFLGWLGADRLREALANTWVLVVPSIWEEGLGMVLVEAGLMGRPVIASKIGGITDVVYHGQNGLLVPPRDPEALAAAIAAVLQDREKARSMGLAGNRIAQEYLQDRDEALENARQAICAIY